MSVKTETSGGVGFFGLLAIVFITLKLTNNITWSWWLVLLPLWWPIPALVVAVVVLVIVELIKD